MALNRIMPGMFAAIRQPFDNGNQHSRWSLGEMVGRSAAMERLLLQMRYLASHLRLALIEGERGTGKRLAARTLHDLGPQRNAPFLECAAVEFFTGGSAARLEAVGGGTLYLTAVDELNHEQQGRLLQLAAWVRAQGETATRRLNAPRLVSGSAGPGSAGPSTAAAERGDLAGPRLLLVSSTRALRPLMLYGRFRSDLQQQLAAVHLLLPPLRARGEDVVLLANLLLAREVRAGENHRRLRGLAPDALPYLLGHKWPGNVAQLEHVLAQGAARAVAAGSDWLRRLDLSSGLIPDAAPPQIAAVRLPRQAHHGIDTACKSCEPQRQATNAGSSSAEEREQDQTLATDPSLERAVHRHIERVLARVGGNKLRAARLLGISRSTLYRHLDEANAVLARTGVSRLHPVPATRDLA